MDYAKFGDFSFSRFYRTDEQTDTQNHRQNHKITDAAKRLTHAIIVGVNNEDTRNAEIMWNQRLHTADDVMFSLLIAQFLG